MYADQTYSQYTICRRFDFNLIKGFFVSCRGAVKIRAEIIILTITISRNVQQKKWNVSSWE